MISDYLSILACVYYQLEAKWKNAASIAIHILHQNRYEVKK